MRTTRLIRFFAVIAGFAMLAAACGGGSDDSSSDDTSGDGGGECAAATAAPDATGVIALEGFDDGAGADNCFSATTLDVTAGEEVTVDFENTGTVPHTFTIEDWDVDTDLIDAGETASVTFTVPADASGEVPFICIPHESLGMVGVMNVS